MRLLVTAGLVSGALLFQASPADARPAQAECVCQVFSRYVSWKSFNTWVDQARDTTHKGQGGLGGNRQIGDAVKARIKNTAHEGYKSTDKKLCDPNNEFIKKVCRAYKACLLAAGGVLYGEWVQGGKDFFASEKDALVACETAIVITFFWS